MREFGSRPRRPPGVAAAASTPARARARRLVPACAEGADGDHGAEQRRGGGRSRPSCERVDVGLVHRVGDLRAGRAAAPPPPRASASCSRWPGGQRGEQRRELAAADAGDQRAEHGDAERAADHAAHRQRCPRRRRPWSGRRRSSPRCSSATSSRPMPMPMRTKAGSRNSVAAVDRRWCDCQSSEPATSSRPTIIGDRGPMRSVRRPAIGADRRSARASRAGSARRPRSGE